MGQQEGVASGFDMFENDTKKVQAGRPQDNKKNYL